MVNWVFSKRVRSAGIPDEILSGVVEMLPLNHIVRFVRNHRTRGSPQVSICGVCRVPCACVPCVRCVCVRTAIIGVGAEGDGARADN